MPAPDALRPILTALGTGGTVEMAEGVHHLISGLTAERDALAADAARLAEVLVTECGATEPGETAYAAVARILRARAAAPALHGEVKAALGEATRMARLREETLISIEQALAGIGVTLIADDDPAAVAGRILHEQATEIRRLNTLLEPKRATLREKIEASSLGTPDAVAARASVPAEVAQAAVARAAALADHGDDLATFTVDDATGGPLPGFPALEDVWVDEPGPAPATPDNLLTDEEASVPHPAPRPPTNDEIRDWCRTNGVAVSDRGPIGKTARRAYDDAHQEA